MAQDDFPERWDEAAGKGHVPELITADRLNGLVRDLLVKDRLIHLQSERLTWMTENASCDDFAGRWLFLVAGSAHEADGRRAALELLKPGPEPGLPGRELPGTAGRAEAIAVARRAVVGYVSGDPERLKSVAAAASP
jgi:hypothetical protein